MKITDEGVEWVVLLVCTIGIGLSVQKIAEYIFR